MWLDNRAEKEANVLNDEFTEKKVYEITGQVKIVPTWPASKILWMRNNEPGRFDRVHKYLLVEDYFIWRMTGQFVSEGSLLCSTAYWDIRTKRWWEDMLEYIDVSTDQLPNIRESGEVVGEINRDVASELGLSSNTIVCTGALDQAAGAVGIGNVSPGIFSENTGAALAICAPMEKLIYDPDMKMPIHYFAIPDMYMFHTFTTGGMVLKWFRDNFCEDEINVGKRSGFSPYHIMDQEARNVEAGSEGLVMLPHLQGAMAPEANPNAKGVFFGFTLKHKKEHFARAIMESIACIVKRNIDVLERMNIDVNEIRVLGGGAKSSLWNQIKADLTGKTVITTKNSEAACLGAAMLAGTAIGMFRSVEDASNTMVTIKDKYHPNSNNHDAYRKTYDNYVSLYDSLCDVFNKTT